MLQSQFSVCTHSMSLGCPEAPHNGACWCLGVPRVGHLSKEIFKIYQIQYLPLKFLKSAKKQKSQLSPATHQAAPRGCLCVPRRAQCGSDTSHKKFVQPQYIYILFAFEIVEIAQKTKKLALLSYPLGSSQGCLGVPRHGPCGSVRSHKIFFEITIHIKSIIYL